MKLGEIVSLIRGNTYKSSLLSETNGPVLLGLGSIQRHGGFKRGAWKHYAGFSDPQILLHPGDIYVSLKDLTQACDILGAVARVPEDITEGRLTQDTVKLRFADNTNECIKLYAYWSLRTPQYRAYCKARGTGTTNMSLSRKDFLSWELPVRSTQNDNLIELFSLIDEKINTNHQTNDYLLEFATAQFEHALEESRTEVLLGDIVALEDSKRIPLNSRDRAQRKGPYPYYGATAIMDYVDDYLFDGIRILLGEDGTVIGDDGKPILQYVWGKYWVNNHAHVLKASSSYSLEAIYVALSRTTINHIVTGAVQMKISQRNLKGLRLAMPNPNMISGLSALFEMYRQNIDENKKLEMLRNSLLPKLMSGEIDVSGVEPAMGLE